MDFDMGKCQSIQRVQGQLTVTDRFTVHEDQIIEMQCSKNPRRSRLCYHDKRSISGQLGMIPIVTSISIILNSLYFLNQSKDSK